MKKLAFLLAFVLILSMPIDTLAAPRVIFAKPQLTFSGTTATCKATVTGNNTSEYIDVTMKLMYGTTCIATWNASGYGYVTMTKTATVTKNRSYTLVLDVSINGVQQDPASVSGTC